MAFRPTPHQRTFLVLAFWAAMFAVLMFWLRTTGLPPRLWAPFLRDRILDAGPLGPILLVLAFVLRSFILVPPTVLTILSGTLFGPWMGLLVALAGENVSAWIVFAMTRHSGRHWVELKSGPRMKAWDAQFSRDGFLATLFQRLFLVPFDITNVLAGLSGMPFIRFAVASAIGVIPATAAYVFLGHSIFHLRGLATFGLFVVFAIGLTLLVRRSPWIRVRLDGPDPEKSAPAVSQP